MAGGLRQRAFLAPAGHPAEYEARIARHHDIGAEAQPLHHAGTKAFDQRIGIGEQVEHLRDSGLVLQIQFDHFPAAPRHRFQVLFRADAVERYDFRAHIGQHHAGERTRADAGEFDDAEAGERAGGAGGGLGGWFVEHLFSLPRGAS